MGLILTFCIAALSLQPLMRVKMHEKLVNTDGIEMTCCQQNAASCCKTDAQEGATTEGCSSEHSCSDLCDCVASGIPVFKIAGSPGLELPVSFVEETKSFESRYHFSLHFSIWHPPRV